MNGAGAGTGTILPVRKRIQADLVLVRTACCVAARGLMMAAFNAPLVGSSTIQAAGAASTGSGWYGRFANE